MHLKTPILRLFCQLGELLERLSDEEYCRPVPLLSGASVGQHVRHVIECFLELEEGRLTGDVNYDLRKRDRRLETDRQFAGMQMAFVQYAFGKPDRPLNLHAAFDEGVTIALSSTYYRELMHNLDHAIHHMAMIRIGVAEFSGVALPESFGVAYSTLKYRSNSPSYK
ncbi:MAG TPA: hypothetical protein VGM31_09270 [Puia sp.]